MRGLDLQALPGPSEYHQGSSSLSPPPTAVSDTMHQRAVEINGPKAGLLQRVKNKYLEPCNVCPADGDTTQRQQLHI